jgi:hypothetical protein
LSFPFFHIKLIFRVLKKTFLLACALAIAKKTFAMKTKIKVIAGMVFLMVLAAGLQGQTTEGYSDNYRIAPGLRAGQTSGVTLNINTKNSGGLEFIAGIWSNWLSLTCLYEKREPAYTVKGLRWYYGAGGHLSTATGTYFHSADYFSRGADYALGIDGTIGLEYKIPQIPFALSAGLKPFIEFYRNGDAYGSLDPGIGIKFTF